MYAGRPEGKCDKHKTVMLNVGAVELSRTSKKKVNSSLSFGQAVLTFFLPGATSCLSSWVILLEDVLPGPLRQVSFSSCMYLPSKKIYKYLPWTTTQDFFRALFGLIKGTNLKLINLRKYEIVHPHFNLDYSFGSKPMFFTHLLQV